MVLVTVDTRFGVLSALARSPRKDFIRGSLPVKALENWYDWV
jgi:hypothetical protein